MREILLKPKPLLHQLEDLPSVELRVLLGGGLLNLCQDALLADATYEVPDH